MLRLHQHICFVYNSKFEKQKTSSNPYVFSHMSDSVVESSVTFKYKINNFKWKSFLYIYWSEVRMNFWVSWFISAEYTIPTLEKSGYHDFTKIYMSRLSYITLGGMEEGLISQRTVRTMSW